MKIATTITIVFLLLNQISKAQLPVSHVPANKNALIEEFTGIHCQYCPDGHRITSEIIAANPGKAFAVNIHTGGYAIPGSGELDLRTSDGDAIVSIPGMGITGYPTGDVNRHLWYGSALAIDRANWALASQKAMADPAYVNIAGEANLNINTKILTVNIEAFYTANSPQATNKFTVMLLQNNINGTQTGASTWNPTMINPDGTYRHMHALRDVLTTAGGDVISTTTSGTTFTKTITYTLPTAIKNIPVKIADLELIAFISEGTAETINVCKIPIKINTNTGITENVPETHVRVYPNPITDNVTVNFTLNESNPVSIVMLNAIGQVVLKKDLGILNAGEQHYSLPATTLDNGLYLLNIQIGNSTSTQKITK